MYLVGNNWANCLKTHKKLTMCLPGKTPSAPSDSDYGHSGDLYDDESPLMVTKGSHKTPGKSVTGYTELMVSLCEKKGTEKSQVFPWLAPGVFPGTLGPPPGAGCPAPASLMGPASIDGALAAPRDADAATVGNLNSHLPIALP